MGLWVYGCVVWASGLFGRLGFVMMKQEEELNARKNYEEERKEERKNQPISTSTS